MPFTGSFVGAKVKKNKIKLLLGLILKRLFLPAILTILPPITHICLAEGVQMKTPTTFMTFVLVIEMTMSRRLKS